MQQVNALPSQLVKQANQAVPANTLELHDIHVPEQIANYPIAYGWWLLAALILLIIVISLIKLKKAAKRNQVKKQALAQLKLLKNNTETKNSDIIALLKWAAMHYFSRAELAKLFGHALQAFFLSKLPVKYQQNFTELSEQAFLKQYQTTTDAECDQNLHQAATLWLTQALPPKPLKNTNQGVSL